MSLQNKKILLIAYSFFPLQDPQALRWYYLSNQLAARGFKVDVVSIRVPENFNARGLRLNPSINVFRVFPGILESISNRVKGKMRIYEPENIGVRRQKKFRLLKGGYWVLRKGMNQLLIGDYRTEWMPFCLRFLRRLDVTSYDVVITSQEPVVDSLIGLWLKKKNKNLSWIADMGDLMSAPYYPRWRWGIDKMFEKKIVTHADGITVTNPAAKATLSARHKIKGDKFFVMKQGFSMERGQDNARRSNEVFTLAYTGTFYEGFRDPTPLIDALSELDLRYKLVVAARTEAFYEKFKRIEKNVSLLGLVPHAESLKIQREADVLIHLSNRHPSQVPGKFYEYLGAQRPVLTIVYRGEDETSLLTKELNLGLVCGNEKNEIKGAIRRLYTLWKEGTLETIFNRGLETLRPYSWEARAEQLVNFMNRVA